MKKKILFLILGIVLILFSAWQGAVSGEDAFGRSLGMDDMQTRLTLTDNTFTDYIWWGLMGIFLSPIGWLGIALTGTSIALIFKKGKKDKGIKSRKKVS